MVGGKECWWSKEVMVRRDGKVSEGQKSCGGAERL